MNAISAYPERDMTDRGVRLRFHRNEAALPAADHVVEAIRGLDGDALRRYPVEAQRELVEALASRVGTSAPHIALGNGADEVIAALGRAFLAPGDRAIVARPSFGMFERTARLVGATPVRVPYRERWRLPIGDLVDAIGERTRLIVLANPNNPTGDALRADDVLAIARRAPGAVVAIDEVYLSLSGRSLLPQLADEPNVLAIGSLSKTAGLAGLRVGYAVAPEPLATVLRSVITPYPLSVAAIVGALAYLTETTATRAYEVALQAQIDRSLSAIESACAPFTRAIWRGNANYLLADFGPGAAQLADALASSGIAVRTFDDPLLAGMIRICAGSDEQTDDLLRALRGELAVLRA